jgi:hypothetical protein
MQQATVRVDDDLAGWITDRAERAMRMESLGVHIRTEVQKWRTIVGAELRHLRFTIGEIGLIADVFGGSLITDAISSRPPMAAIEVMDARDGMEGSYGDKWGVDEMALVEKLLGLGPAADHALIDAVSRWWAADGEHTAAGWAAVGLTIRDNDNPDRSI